MRSFVSRNQVEPRLAAKIPQAATPGRRHLLHVLRESRLRVVAQLLELAQQPPASFSLAYLSGQHVIEHLRDFREVGRVGRARREHRPHPHIPPELAQVGAPEPRRHHPTAAPLDLGVCEEVSHAARPPGKI